MCGRFRLIYSNVIAKYHSFILHFFDEYKCPRQGISQAIHNLRSPYKLISVTTNVNYMNIKYMAGGWGGGMNKLNSNISQEIRKCIK